MLRTILEKPVGDWTKNDVLLGHVILHQTYKAANVSEQLFKECHANIETKLVDFGLTHPDIDPSSEI